MKVDEGRSTVLIRILPVVIISAVNAILASKARQGCFKGPSALVTSETLTVPRFIHGHQVETVRYGETATGADRHRGLPVLFGLLLDSIFSMEALHRFAVVIVLTRLYLFILLLLLLRR